MSEKVPLLIIAGPTASGKSDAAVELALKLDGEIISADSMQVYKYMDIGTAKVDRATQDRVPHYMLDIVEPDEDYSLAQYKEQATVKAKEIWNRGKLPILAGGTGMYIRAITDNYPLEHLPFEPDCRAQLNETWNQRGREYMRAWLEGVDPDTAAKVQDRRRIIRALEIYQLTGRASSQIQREARETNPFLPLQFALTLERPILYAKIEARTELMVIQGIIGEYNSLIERGFSPQANAMLGLGYRHCGMYVQGLWTLEEMKEQLKRDTRRFAKRQLSWFRGMKGMRWLDNSHPWATVERIFAAIAGITRT